MGRHQAVDRYEMNLRFRNAASCNSGTYYVLRLVKKLSSKTPIRLSFPDIFFGLPMTRPGSLESKIQDAHKNYLVAELVVERSQKSEWRKYAEFLRLRVKENGPMLNADQVCSGRKFPVSLPTT